MKIKLAAVVLAMAFMSSCATEESEIPSSPRVNQINNAPTGEDPIVPSTSYSKVFNSGQSDMYCDGSGGNCLAEVPVGAAVDHEMVDYINTFGGHDAFTTYEAGFSSVIPSDIFDAVLDGSLAVTVTGDNSQELRYLSFTNNQGEVTRVIPLQFGS